MKEKIFAVIGSFATRPDSHKGIHIFSYEPESAAFTLAGDYYTDLNAGQRAYSEKRDVLYIANEVKGEEGEPGGGGSIYSFKLDHETGAPVLLNRQNTCSTLPCDVLLESGERFLLVPHHCSRNVVTKLKRTEDGRMEAYMESDDCILAVFPVNEDGSIGEICDACPVEAKKEYGRIQKLPHLHSCIQSPDGKLLAACDKGLDVIHTYGFHEETGKVLPLRDTKVGDGTHPRYGVFHPTLPVLYTNCENSAYLYVWKYDSRTGALEPMQRLSLLEDETLAAEWVKEGASDIVLTRDARILYVSVRGLNRISAFRIKEDGTAALIGDTDCQGSNPRGLCLSPDERYLFALNRDSGCIARFKREADGRLQAAGAETECSLPANMIFISYEDERPGLRSDSFSTLISAR